VFFRFSGVNLTMYDGTNNYYHPLMTNVWYEILLVMDWAGQRFDWYVDGVLIQANIPFRGVTPDVQEFHLYNYSANEVAWFDEIEFRP